MNKAMKQQGFTLIEVLISAIILFTSIALVAELFTASSFSSRKASAVAQVNQTIPLVQEIVKNNVQLQAKNRDLSYMQGEVLAFGYTFVWQAERLSLLPAALEEVSDTPGESKFGLFKVSLTTEKKKTSEYIFEVATW